MKGKTLKKETGANIERSIGAIEEWIEGAERGE
jgi:hypothetical protein